MFIITSDYLGADGKINVERREMERLWKKAVAVKIETLKATCKFVLEPRAGLTLIDSATDKILIGPSLTLFCKFTAELTVN